MTPTPPRLDPARAARLRLLVQRLELAGQHQRAARARRLGVGQAELAALEHLTSAGHLTPKQLASRLGRTSGGLTGLVDRLRGAGHVASDRHPYDRRMRILTPTAAGTALMVARLEPVLTAGDPALRLLSAADAELVERVLQALVLLKEEMAAGAGSHSRGTAAGHGQVMLM